MDGVMAGMWREAVWYSRYLVAIRLRL